MRSSNYELGNFFSLNSVEKNFLEKIGKVPKHGPTISKKLGYKAPEVNFVPYDVICAHSEKCKQPIGNLRLGLPISIAARIFIT